MNLDVFRKKHFDFWKMFLVCLRKWQPWPKLLAFLYHITKKTKRSQDVVKLQYASSLIRFCMRENCKILCHIFEYPRDFTLSEDLFKRISVWALDARVTWKIFLALLQRCLCSMMIQWIRATVWSRFMLGTVIRSERTIFVVAVCCLN